MVASVEQRLRINNRLDLEWLIERWRSGSAFSRLTPSTRRMAQQCATQLMELLLAHDEIGGVEHARE